MNEYLQNGVSFDLDYYKSQEFQSVHIGDFVVKQESEKANMTSLNLAVLMPVFNTKADHLKQAVESV